MRDQKHKGASSGLMRVSDFRGQAPGLEEAPFQLGSGMKGVYGARKGGLFGLVQVVALDFSPPGNIHCDTGFIIVLRLIAVRVVYLV